MKREEYCRASYLLKNGELWMAGNQSVSIFDVRQRKYLSLPEAIASHPVLSHVPVEYIYPYENGVLLCTQGRECFITTKHRRQSFIRVRMVFLLKSRILRLAVCLMIHKAIYGLVQ